MAKVNSTLMSQMRMVVAAEGDMVKLSIGNCDIHMPYAAALQLSQWLRMRGKEAKRNAGDLSRHWSLLATLDGLKL